mmetsp:Transcript_57386/g.99656  ORF Transcript_57386/g.99656 Transcript_57386/m.99656 type:complete len:111 (+) Transcript_57386:143-475(+)
MAPSISKAEYTSAGLQLVPEEKELTVCMPIDTAGFNEPPDKSAAANPPTVTHEPIARANMVVDFVFSEHATLSTTKTRSAVKMISPNAMGAQVSASQLPFFNEALGPAPQ